MASASWTQPDRVATVSEEIRQSLDRWRGTFLEVPDAALAEAIRCREFARSIGDEALSARARALEGAVSLHRGDLRSALELLVDAERHCEHCADDVARAELAALESQLNLFTGSYAEALSHAERALVLADRTADLGLRIYVRRATCMVFGNIGVPRLRERIEELLALTVVAGDRWEETISLNDLACNSQAHGDLEGAEREIDRALEVGMSLPPPRTFLLAVVHSTRADIRLLAGRAEDALADAERSIALLCERGEPNPYVLGVTVRAEVQARMALGQLAGAQEAGEGALAQLGDRVPQTRSVILTTLAETLREAGRVEEAYDALARASELERQAFHELSDLQLRLERATLEATAARRESDALAASNRELARAHTELERRAGQLERLQEQLRDQAERDWLTGLHNRRYLAGELERLEGERLAVPLSLAVLDLDDFKAINDRHGHATGDEVLIRVAGLLCDVLREADTVVRSGGEEFIVLMPHTDVRAATACCERMREVLGAESWERIAPGIVVTTSVGVATTTDTSRLEALVKLSDQRLYEAKRAGRDRVISGPELS